MGVRCTNARSWVASNASTMNGAQSRSTNGLLRTPALEPALTIFVAASTINRDGIVAAAVDTDAKKEEEAAQLRKHTSHPEQVTRQRVWRDSLKLMYI